MINNKIEYVWGNADNFDLVLTQSEKDEWYAEIPLDLSDGWYAVVLHAQDTKNKIGTWHGVLYVANGFSHLHINEEKFTWWLLSQTNLKLTPRAPRCELILQEECEYHGS